MDFQRYTQLLHELLVVTDHPVEALVLPHPAKSLMLVLHLMGGERLPGMKYALEFIGRKRRQQGMDMIVHYHINE